MCKKLFKVILYKHNIMNKTITHPQNTQKNQQSKQQSKQQKHNSITPETKKKNRPIDRVTVTNLDIALRMCNFKLDRVLIDRIICLVRLIEDKGDKLRKMDICKLQAEWGKKNIIFSEKNNDSEQFKNATDPESLENTIGE